MGLVFAGPTGPWSWSLVGAFSSHLPRLPQFPPLLPPPPQASPSRGEAEALAHLSSKEVSGKTGEFISKDTKEIGTLLLL